MQTLGSQWVLYVDVSSNINSLDAGLILVSPKGGVLQYALHFAFPTTNNEVENEVLISGLKISKELGIHCLKTYSDSLLLWDMSLGSIRSRRKT